jgi:hypothetical protein
MFRFAGTVILSLAALGTGPALAQAGGAAADAGEQPEQSVTVIGERIQDYRDRLNACLARNCPVNEDVDATMALAEVEYEAGDYAGARRDVAASIGRNRDQAHAFPEPVADLFRARTRIARTMGRDGEAMRASYDILNSLNAGIPREDYRQFTARLEIVEMLLTQGRATAARHQLEELADHARAAGRPDVAAIARLRLEWLSYQIAPGGDAVSHLIEMSRNTDPDHRITSVGAKMLLSRIYRERGDTQRADALVAEVARAARSDRRTLLTAPPYHVGSVDLANNTDAGDPPSTVDANVRIPDMVDNQWIDVGFWIESDGHVQDVDVVRQRGSLDWAQSLLNSVRGRVYTASADGSPTYRLERYIYTAPLVQTTGTRIPQRGMNARVEYYDLSVGEPPPEDVVPHARPGHAPPRPATS